MNEDFKPTKKTVTDAASELPTRKRSLWLPVFVLLGVFLASFIPMQQLKPLLAQRDDMITLLSRGDTASAGRLEMAYIEFRKVLGK